MDDKICGGCADFSAEPKGAWRGTCNRLGIGRHPETPVCEQGGE